MSLAFRLLGTGRLAKHRRVLTEEDGDPIEAGADPDQLARGTQLVELTRRVAGHPAWKHVALPELDRERQALQRNKRLAEGCASVDAVPARQETAESRLLGGLDLAAQRGQRCASQSPQHLDVAPLALRAPRSQLPTDELVLALERPELFLRPRLVDREASGDLAGGEGPARAGESCEERAECVLDGLQECVRKPARRHHAQGVAVPAGVLHRR